MGTYVGIDVSKDRLDVHILAQDDAFAAGAGRERRCRGVAIPELASASLAQGAARTAAAESRDDRVANKMARIAWAIMVREAASIA
jgi:hypothetical protein